MKYFKKECEDAKNLTASVEENEQRYNKKEIEGARKSRLFVERAAFPSMYEARRMVQSGYIRDLDFNEEDLERCFDINGRLIPYLKGTMTKKRAGKLKSTDMFEKCKVVEQELFSDIMVIMYTKSGAGYLVSVAKPLDLTMTTSLREGNRAINIEAAFREQMSLLLTRKFRVWKISTDPESSIEVLNNTFAGVIFNPGGAGDHVPVADKKIRALKEIIRCVKSSLKWKVPCYLRDALVTYATHRLNCRAGRSNEKPTRVAFTGVAIRMNKDLALSFGELCVVYNPSATSNSVEDSRGDLCVALYPTGNDQGSWAFMQLENKEIIQRSNFKSVVATDRRDYGKTKKFTQGVGTETKPNKVR